jgi:hypothetical protein
MSSSSGGAGARARGSVLALALLCLAMAGSSSAQTPVGDVLPFRIVYGNPNFAESGKEITCYLWSEGGRLHLRITPDGKSHEVEGELRTSSGGILRDVAPLSENLRVRQPSPARLLFDVSVTDQVEGLDIVLGGDAAALTVDLRIDLDQKPHLLRIGEGQERPRGLPAELRISGAEASWIERFGFR